MHVTNNQLERHSSWFFHTLQFLGHSGKTILFFLVVKPAELNVNPIFIKILNFLLLPQKLLCLGPCHVHFI